MANLNRFAEDAPIYGLTVRAGTAYVSVWNKGAILAVNIETHQVDIQFDHVGTDAMFGMVFVDIHHQTTGNLLVIAH